MLHLKLFISDVVEAAYLSLMSSAGSLLQSELVRLISSQFPFNAHIIFRYSTGAFQDKYVL